MSLSRREPNVDKKGGVDMETSVGGAAKMGRSQSGDGIDHKCVESLRSDAPDETPCLMEPSNEVETLEQSRGQRNPQLSKNGTLQKRRRDDVEELQQ